MLKKVLFTISGLLFVLSCSVIPEAKRDWSEVWLFMSVMGGEKFSFYLVAKDKEKRENVNIDGLSAYINGQPVPRSEDLNYSAGLYDALDLAAGDEVVITVYYDGELVLEEREIIPPDMAGLTTVPEIIPGAGSDHANYTLICNDSYAGNYTFFTYIYDAQGNKLDIFYDFNGTNTLEISNSDFKSESISQMTDIEIQSFNSLNRPLNSDYFHRSSLLVVEGKPFTIQSLQN